jgi:hypothetical protein
MGRTNPLRGTSRIGVASGATPRIERLKVTATLETAISGETTFFARSTFESLYRDTGHFSQSVEQQGRASNTVLQSDTHAIPRMATSAAIFAVRLMLPSSTRKPARHSRLPRFAELHRRLRPRRAAACGG